MLFSIAVAGMAVLPGAGGWAASSLDLLLPLGNWIDRHRDRTRPKYLAWQNTSVTTGRIKGGEMFAISILAQVPAEEGQRTLPGILRGLCVVMTALIVEEGMSRFRVDDDIVGHIVSV